jgi:predicted lipid-binding transport protein (Tim44 family)
MVARQKAPFESAAIYAYVGQQERLVRLVSEIVIFAVIAAFLGLRLYSVLGKRTGHEQSMGNPGDSPLVRQPAVVAQDDTPETAPALAIETSPFDDATSAGLRAISSADSRFNAADFVAGARAAYEVILGAYWKGDRETLQSLVGDDVFEAFDGAISGREASGDVLDNRLVRVERVAIAEASVSGKVARIMVRFDADIAAVTRDKTGKVIAGSLTDAVPTHDAWTFERHMKAAEPGWILVDTDEAE